MLKIFLECFFFVRHSDAEGYLCRYFVTGVTDRCLLLVAEAVLIMATGTSPRSWLVEENSFSVDVSVTRMTFTASYLFVRSL